RPWAKHPGFHAPEKHAKREHGRPHKEFVHSDYNLGLAQLLRGEYTLAVKHFDVVINKDRKHLQAHYNRGYAHFLNKDYELAIYDFVDAQHGPTFVQASEML